MDDGGLTSQFFLLVALGVGAVASIVWMALKHGTEVRVNVLALSVVLVVVVCLGLLYAKSVGEDSQKMYDELRAVIGSDGNTAADRLAALNGLTEKANANLKELLTAIGFITLAVGGVIGAIGYLLRGDNDLKEPHNRAIDGLVAAANPGDAARAKSLNKAVGKTKEALDNMRSDE